MTDKGLSPTETTVSLSTMLFAAITNTGNVATWILLHLEANPKWKALVEDETRQLNADTDLRSLYFRNVAHAFQRTLYEVMYRRRLIFVDQKRIPRGTYIIFQTGDLYDNADFYSTSKEFNPEHFSADALQERRKNGTTFLRWGAGHHVCAGRRAVQMLMKILLLSQFDIRILDEGGNRCVHPSKL